ncbi:MAG TPA: platelet-activating factor acetylhydrolase IB subunit [Lacunisphaera sp.]|jgi:lysophospholipase L1-like esterase
MKLSHKALFLAFLLLVPASFALAQNPAPENPAIVPTLRNDWLQRHNGFVAEARKGGIDLLFVGDSITDFWRNRGKAVWNERYAPLKAANFGISGDRTEHVLWRLQNGELQGIDPKVTILMIGTNNTWRDTAGQIAAGVTAIVDEIKKQLPHTKILLLAIFPRAEKPDSPLRAQIAATNAILSKLDDGGRTVAYLDIGEKFLQPDGVLPASIMPDFLHPNEKGYEIWANAMEPKLTALLGNK